MSAPLVLPARLASALVRLPSTSAEDQLHFQLATLSGRIVELCGAGTALSWAMGLALEAQLKGEPAAWIGGTEASFYPPDAAASGLDLDALVVVRAGAAASRARAADELCRSGAFALVVVDLVDEVERVPPALLSRLLGLAQKHQTAIVFLTRERDHADAGPSLGSLVSLRAVARCAHQGGRFRASLEVVKDKKHAPGWRDEVMLLAPLGLR